MSGERERIRKDSPMKKTAKRKARVIWAIEASKSLICADNKLVIGVCFPTKKFAEHSNVWAKGKVIKFVEFIN